MLRGISLCKLTVRVGVKATLASWLPGGPAPFLISGRACAVLISQWLEEFANKVVWASSFSLSWLNLYADFRAYLLFLPVSALVSCAFFPKKVHFIQDIKVTGINLPVTSFSNWKSGQAACHSKARKEARWVERKVCFILDVINCRAGRADICPKADRPSPPWTSRGKKFYRRGGWRGLRAETAGSALTVFLKLVLCGLVSVVFTKYR